MYRSEKAFKYIDFKHFIHRFFKFQINLKGRRVNICDEKYMHIASLIHHRFHDTLISACTGSSCNFKI